MKNYSTIRRAPFCPLNPDGDSSTFLSNSGFSTGLFSINKGALLRSTAIEDKDFKPVVPNRLPFIGQKNPPDIDLLYRAVGNIDNADISEGITPRSLHYFNIPINRFVLGLFICAMCAVAAFFLTPASSGTWGEVLDADCAAVKNGDVLLSADAFIAAKCGVPKLGVTYCVHWPYDPIRPETHTSASLIATLQADNLMRGSWMSILLPHMHKTSASELVCMRIWHEKQWRNLM